MAPQRGMMSVTLLYAYMLMSIAMGISAIVKGAVYPGITGIVGPILCWWAASGLKGSLLVGTRSQTLWSLASAIVFAAVGFGSVYRSGYGVRIFSLGLTGVAWCGIGLIIGYIVTNRDSMLLK